MNVVLVRIDDRLVHGQVVLGWIPFVRAELVLVVSETAARDETLVALMSMALPEGVDLRVVGVQEALSLLSESATTRDQRRVLVLAPGPQEVLRLVEGGVAISDVNVGGLHYTAGRVQLGKAIFLSEEDKAALRGINEQGVRLEGRALPNDSAMDIIEMISSGSAR